LGDPVHRLAHFEVLLRGEGLLPLGKRIDRFLKGRLRGSNAAGRGRILALRDLLIHFLDLALGFLSLPGKLVLQGLLSGGFFIRLFLLKGGGRV
jgi:hypothetical protein